MTPQQAYDKCYSNNQRDKDLELIIIKDPQYAYQYARDVIKGRWKEAESIIIKDSFYAYRYAKDVIEGKLPESMHNQMLIAGIGEYKYDQNIAKAYLNFIS
jgi:hypothetical protein